MGRRRDRQADKMTAGQTELDRVTGGHAGKLSDGEKWGAATQGFEEV